MASKWSNIAGTVLGYFRLGVSGVRLKDSSGSLSVRNANDSADAVVLPQSLGTGTRDGTKYLRDDGVWVTLDAILANTSTPALKITQTGSGHAFLVEDSASPDSTPFVVDSNGFVRQGYNTSVSALGYQQALEVYGQSGTVGLYRFSADSAGAELVFAKSRGSLGTNTIIQNNDAFALLRFSGADGTNYIEGARIAASVDGTPGTNSMPGRLVFSTTAAGASTVTERMRIRSDGNIGIGGVGNAAQTLQIVKNITGGVDSRGVTLSSVIQQDVTSIAYGFVSVLSTQAAAFTIPNIRQFQATQGNIGAGSAITNQAGFVADSSLIGATNNYGFQSNISAGTGRWNVYSAGTANNAFNGNSSFGKVSVPIASIDCTSQAVNLVTNSAATYTVLSTDHTIIQTTAGSTYTLPAAASFTKRVLHIVTQFSGAVISDSSNVVPIAGGAAGTAILSATAGKYAKLQSNGTNWVIIEAN